MSSKHGSAATPEPFRRGAFSSGERATRIGDGELGGKGKHLVRAWESVRGLPSPDPETLSLTIPPTLVLTTELFDEFVKTHRLRERVDPEMSESEIALAFTRCDLPPRFAGDLYALVEEARMPLAVRSSSQLEDALEHPLAGVFATKMLPNEGPDPESRFRGLSAAIKLVMASSFFPGARAAIRAAGADPDEEKMAVVVQALVGARRGRRYYPLVSGVGRSWNVYPRGREKPEEGVVQLALGLGIQIVDGGRSWAYVPARPKVGPPFASRRAMLEETQTSFIVVDMGERPNFEPTKEREHLLVLGLEEAERDGVLAEVASTWDPQSDRLTPGTGRAGARVLDFAPLLQLRKLPLNEGVAALLEASKERLGGEVEIEFALDDAAGRGRRAQLALLQLRAMPGERAGAAIAEAELAAAGVLVASRRTLGAGRIGPFEDVVYCPPERFEAKATPRIAEEIAAMNRRLVAEGRGYLLGGFGRFGSSDPWLGIPVRWEQIAGARAIFEASLPTMNVDPSQGSHFFHNVVNLGLAYMTVRHDEPGDRVEWEALAAAELVAESEHVRWVRLARPHEALADGRGRLGLVRPLAAEEGSASSPAAGDTP